jgi:hypothetical protein
MYIVYTRVALKTFWEQGCEGGAEDCTCVVITG